ncbi:MAG: biotin--[acetyl-CoA-carboxylase] ligase [Propionibacteriaceae bacterium]|nr:biotin--[acetyl-CoA-carboxylase] ligase [Propionibacteriaceae bacterium]
MSDQIASWKIDVVERTGSTNSDLVARVRRGACPDYSVLIGLAQDSGKGRLDRAWSTPPGSAVAVSVAVPLSGIHWELLPVAAGMAVVRGLGDLGVNAGLKWPNDVLIGEKKVCGILVEVAQPASPDSPAGLLGVIGIGVNVSQTGDTVEFPGAISLSMAGVQVTREQVVAAILIRLGQTVGCLGVEEDRLSLLQAYRQVCRTVGQQVRVVLGEQNIVEGKAVDIGEDGRLLVDVDGQVRAFSSGDVVHLR